MTYSELHSAWETQRDRLAEAEYEIERQHEEILELKDRRADLVQERAELSSVIDANGLDLKELEALAERLSAAITSAVADLRVIGEVPLGQLEESLKAIADRLADKNGERY